MSKRKSKDDVYTVEAVINKRVQDGKVQYLLKWKDFDLEESTWEPEENISCPDLVREYEAKIKKRTEASDSMDYVKNLASKAADAAWREKEIQQIYGITKAPGELYFLVRWTDDTADLVPAKQLNTLHPQKVIEFYESKLSLGGIASSE
ncbi:hypothetical protein WR25_26783 [Diploscapter pachys]|uniref:Chromo domain-containing protein n=1 Tax=Diploscapter pachys TaxID=2018661 RepID=A0A2A2KSJ7_9BILA|nr:hypothetical protein WR25_26783 [Diploscapter pachys]